MANSSAAVNFSSHTHFFGARPRLLSAVAIYSTSQNCQDASRRQIFRLSLPQNLEIRQVFLQFWGFDRQKICSSICILPIPRTAISTITFSPDSHKGRRLAFRFKRLRPAPVSTQGAAPQFAVAAPRCCGQCRYAWCQCCCGQECPPDAPRLCIFCNK